MPNTVSVSLNEDENNLPFLQAADSPLDTPPFSESASVALPLLQLQRYANYAGEVEPDVQDGTGSFASHEDDSGDNYCGGNNGVRWRTRNLDKWKRTIRKQDYNLGKSHLTISGTIKMFRSPKTCDCSKCGFRLLQ